MYKSGNFFLSYFCHFFKNEKILHLFQVYDGISPDTCKITNKSLTYTYTAGTLIGGLVEEAKVGINLNHLRIVYRSRNIYNFYNINFVNVFLQFRNFRYHFLNFNVAENKTKYTIL